MELSGVPEFLSIKLVPWPCGRAPQVPRLQVPYVNARRHGVSPGMRQA